MTKDTRLRLTRSETPACPTLLIGLRAGCRRNPHSSHWTPEDTNTNACHSLSHSLTCGRRVAPAPGYGNRSRCTPRGLCGAPRI